MTISYRARPGAGFVLCVVVVSGTIAFFAWGARSPPLEKVWQLQIELETGTHPRLSRSEREIFGAALVRYPDFADTLLGGAPAGLISANDGGLVQGRYAYAVRRSPAPRMLLRVVPTRTLRDALQVRARTSGAAHESRIDEQTTFSWELPDDGPFPQLIDVQILDGARGRRRWSALVRLEPLP